jgi:hypothetical protein
MAVLLSGAVISHEEEKALLNRSSDIIVFTGNENSRAKRNCSDLTESENNRPVRNCSDLEEFKHTENSSEAIK